jgi:serine/threonine protein kinase
MANFGGTSKSLPPRLEHFVMTEKLGQGTYATVYKAYRKVTFNMLILLYLLKESLIIASCMIWHLDVTVRCAFRARLVKLWQLSVFI